MRAPGRRGERRLGIALALGLALGLAAAPAAFARPDLAEHVVALHVTHQAFDAERPWAKTRPQNRFASAVVVDGPRLLTRAHMVVDATLIQVEKRGDADLTAARVVHVDPEIDLALLTVDAPGFFDELDEAPLARAVPTEGTLDSARWRSRQLEVSRSRVARIEVRPNRSGNIEHAFLLLRTDLSNGGWAEPVFDDGRLVGLTAAQEEQVAAVIPAEVLRSYLEQVDGEAPYRGFASFGAVWQNNRDRALARFLGLSGEPRGIVIRQTRPGSSAHAALRPRDVLLAVGDEEIDSIGNYAHPRYGRLRFTHLAVEDRRPGDRIELRVWRDGRELEVELPLRRYPSGERLVPWRQDGRPPPYLVAGGLLFRELDGDYLRTWGANWSRRAPSELVTRYHLEAHAQSAERRRIVLLTRVLPDAYNLGYHGLSDLPVRSVNGHPIGKVADVARAFESGREGFHRVVFEPNASRAQLVLDAAQFQEASERILRAYDIPARLRLPAGGEVPAGPGPDR